MVILLHAFVSYGWREIGYGVIKGLHLDQKTVLLKWNALYVISQFSQGLGVRGVGKLAHVHFDGTFLEIVPSFDHASPSLVFTYNCGELFTTLDTNVLVSWVVLWISWSNDW